MRTKAPLGIKLLRIAIISQIIVALSALVPGVALAHWKKCQNGYKLRWESSNATYFYPNNWSSRYANATDNAAASITNNTDFSFQKGASANSADVSWHKDNYGNSGWDGLAHRTWTESSTACYLYKVDTYYNTYWTGGYTAGATQSVGIHETGHAIGMKHVNDQCTLNSIMQPAYDCRWKQKAIKTVQAHDISDINATY
ncbi:MAG TPA: matrixin family metalloprotease [Actinomycetota bacterium]|jgi:predicted Zn-dependent protease